MSKMNHEHRNRMQKVWSNPPSRPVKKRKKRKGNTRPKTALANNQGHVKMKSKYNSKCGACTEPIRVGSLIWWNPEEKYVIHDNCFEKYFR